MQPMRLNKFLAQSTGLSRRAADAAIADGRVSINRQPAELGQIVTEADEVLFAGKHLRLSHLAAQESQLIMMNKPPGYVVSRDGQGSPTIYDILPAAYHHLKPIGRLDKHSSGLLLLTTDGQLAHNLTHPSKQKLKVYKVMLDRALTPEDKAHIEKGVMLEDGLSQLTIETISNRHISAPNPHSIPHNPEFVVRMHEGRNRQIRRTFAALGYKVAKLHRTHFGPYALEGMAAAAYRLL